MSDIFDDIPFKEASGERYRFEIKTALPPAEWKKPDVPPETGADPELKNEPSSILPGHITYTNTLSPLEIIQRAFDRLTAPPCDSDGKTLSPTPRLHLVASEGRAADDMAGFRPMTPSKPEPSPERPFLPRKLGEY